MVRLRARRTMKRGKEEDMATGPLFPRLHVNGAADKAAPRAPPRNKMALYEQLSIPSHRFNAAAGGSSLLRPPHSAGTLQMLASASSTQGCGHERSIFSPFYVPPHTPAHLAERFHSCSSDEVNLNTTRMEFETRSIKHVNNRTLNVTDSVAECSLLRPHNSSSTKNSSCKVEYEDAFRVPTFIQSGITAYLSKDTAVVEPERLTPFYANSPQKSCSAAFNSSIQFPNSNNKSLGQIMTSDMISGKYERNHSEEKHKETLVFKEPPEKSVSLPESGEKFAELSNFAKASSDQDHTSASNACENSCYRNTRLGQESSDNDALGGSRCLNDIDVVETGDTIRVRNKSSSKASVGNICNNPNVSDKGNKQSDDKSSGSFKMGDAENTDEVSEASMVDSIPGMEISPDDVVGVIGPKHFLKTRRAIVNQQRIFAVQVFELHRLIKVQKLIAASPHLLLEGNPCLSRSPPKVPTKSLRPDSIKSHPQTVKKRDDSHKPNQNTECPTENTVRATPLPSRQDGLSNGLPGQIPRSGPFSGNPSPGPMTSHNKASTSCFQPPPNQWLVPVMSPSEGLVYKPYAGPCAPTAGFVAPIYRSCAPLSLPPVVGDFMNTAYGVAASHQKHNMGILSGAPAIAPNYFPAPYGLPIVNPIISASVVEQVSPLAGLRPHGHAEQHSRSSCNMSNPKSWKFQASKESELQGSTASSPCEKEQEGEDNVLPLFPTTPTAEGLTRPRGRDNQTRVIKVVPHNARSATETAARIFRSIQKEREQYDS